MIFFRMASPVRLRLVALDKAKGVPLHKSAARSAPELAQVIAEW
jgi:hypothetical protein